MRSPRPCGTADQQRAICRALGASPCATAAAPGRRRRRPPLPPTAAADAADDEPLGWEEAGCLVWDVAALPDDAAFLVQHGLPAMLPPLLAATAAAERWRPLEIGLGVLGNLACHAAVKPQLLQQRQLAELLLDTALWVDDAASLAELCRCLASLLADSNPQVG